MRYPSVAQRYGTTKEECMEMGCTWVEGYYRKDGVYVDGYCRTEWNRKQW